LGKLFSGWGNYDGEYLALSGRQFTFIEQPKFHSFFVSTASGEFDDGGNPAKSRAVSLAIDPSEPSARAALSITTSVVRMAATILFTGKRHRLRNIREEKSGPGRRLPPH
jgi:hypothetical protein